MPICRTFVSGVAVKSHGDIPELMAQYIDPAFLQSYGYDSGVYKRNDQFMAAIGGIKDRDDPRVLTPAFDGIADDKAIAEMSDDDLLKYVAQHYEPEWPVMALRPDLRVPDVPHASSITAYTGEKDERLVALVALLDEQTAEDRCSWRNVAMLLKLDFGNNTDLYVDEFIAFSRLSTAQFDKRGADGLPLGLIECEKLWKSIKPPKVPPKKPLTAGTLYMYARRDNLAGFRVWSLDDKGLGFIRPKVDADEKQLYTLRVLLKILASPLVPASARVQLGPLSHKVTFFTHLVAAPDPSIIEDAMIKSKGNGVMDLTEPGHYIITYDQGRVVVTTEDDLPVLAQCVYRDHPLDVGTDLACINKDILSGQQWSVMRPADNNACFRNKDRTTTIELLNVDTPGYETVRVGLVNKCVPPSHHKGNIATLQAALKGAVTKDALGRLGLSWALAIVGDNNNVTLNVNSNGKDDDTDFDIVRDALLDHAAKNNKKKADGMIYGRIGSTCAYVPEATYKEYINTVLAGNRAYLSHPRHYSEALEFLQNYDVAELPEIRPDRNVLSVRNGIFLLKEGTFKPYVDGDASFEGIMARHHIDLDYDAEEKTPLFDALIAAQFDDDVAFVLKALMGRMFFQTGQLDNFQVMAFLVGLGGTGKSIIISGIVKLWFSITARAHLAGKREEIFGMANLAGKEVILGIDMPAKLSGAIPQEMMQSMVSGDGMEVPRKRDVALHVDWKVPGMMASNHMPDYVNTGNNVARRLVTFRFDNVISAPQEDLAERIAAEELVAIAAKAVRCYHAFRAKAKVMGGFWKTVPPKMLEWQSKLAAATNKLHAFLDMSPDERGNYAIARVPGRVTWLLEFESVFKEVMGTTVVHDASVFSRFGFRISDGPVHVCMACKQLAKNRGTTKCCDAYSHDNRRVKKVIYDMSFTDEPAPAFR